MELYASFGRLLDTYVYAVLSIVIAAESMNDKTT